MNEHDEIPPLDSEVNQRKEREFDLLTFVLAGALAAVVLIAIGYGIFNSSRLATAIPSPGRLHHPFQTAAPLPQRSATTPTSTTGTK
jgi:hypothetical protein